MAHFKRDQKRIFLSLSLTTEKRSHGGPSYLLTCPQLQHRALAHALQTVCDTVWM